MRHYIAQLSLIHGWLPVLVQLTAALVLVGAIGWRTRRWRVIVLPGIVAVGVVVTFCAHWFLGRLGIAGDPAPRLLWFWIGAVGLAVGLVVVGWRGVRWWRRGLSVSAVPLCVACTGLMVNAWVGYLPTVHVAWSQLTSAPLPGQVDRGTILAMQLSGVRPRNGVMLPVTIPSDASGFRHRTELVYLPPAWFGRDPAPRLPVVLMIGSALNTPADWVWAGRAAQTADDFAAEHGGNVPVLVFADATGAFDNDTECVNGSRGNAADHLVKDVVPYMISNFRVSTDRRDWGVAGWSMGGTCALDLTVMHPDKFTAFVDIAGDAGPNVGNKAQTITTLFGGDPNRYAVFDPATVITRHGHYSSVAGWFDIPDNMATGHRSLTGTDAAVSDGPRDGVANPEGQDLAANSLCALANTYGIRCAVSAQPGKHDWPFAAQAFGAALPWLAGRLATPQVPRISLPGVALEHNLAVQAASPNERHEGR